MVTGRDDVIDRVVGLEIGADDYITKPFHVREVTARVKSVLRRTRMAAQPGAGPAPSGDVLEFEGFRLIPDRMQLTNPQGKAVHLTSGDLRLLEAFLAHPKRVLTRDVLMDMTGGATYSPLDRAIDNQIARLRKKLGAGQKTAFPIKTLRGLGYMLACDVKTLAS
jgi:DNA-binding response OmpR family regulator